jgi:hypothetical protein
MKVVKLLLFAGAFSLWSGLMPWGHEPTFWNHVQDSCCIATGALVMAIGVIKQVEDTIRSR